MSYGAPPPPPPGGYGYGYTPGPYAAVPRNNGKAIAALVCGILSFVCCGFVTGIAGIVLGVIARNEIDASGGAQTGRGMAIAGMVCGIIGSILSVVVIIVEIAFVNHGGNGCTGTYCP